MCDNDSTDARMDSLNFIERIINEDLETDKYDGRVHTRFPPEPNGHLHIGHAKSICLNFGTAEKYGGLCNLRFDDTNPLAEKKEYIDAIKEDVQWLGFDWDDREYYASNYFQKLYEYAVQLVKAGKAYVDDQSAEEIRRTHGTLTEPGENSPYRERSVEENLDLFKRMHAGEFEEGTRVLRAKIDMAAANVNMRDPIIYRIKYAEHPRTGDKWNIYPTYDFTHCLSDSIERITHSLCTLEFEDHRPLYDWFLDELDVYHSQQIEFAPLNLSYTVLSKRRLIELVRESYVSGWDDPRMPTISGLRRRGYTPEAIKDFCNRIGVAKAESLVDIKLLEACIREDLNRRAARRMAVMKPLKLVIDNYPDDKVEYMESENNPEDESMGVREIPFSRVVYIERDDFMEEPIKKFFRLAPGREVRLKDAYYVKCVDFVKDDKGELEEVHCTYDPESRGGWIPGGRRVKGTLHWVSAEHALDAEVRLYERFFYEENPLDVEDGKDFKDNLNTDSLGILTACKVEPSFKETSIEDRFQFFRKGYFCVDPDTTENKLVFNRIVSLRDSWSKLKKKIMDRK